MQLTDKFRNQNKSVLEIISRLTSGASETWYWGSGELIDDPWCDTQPDLDDLNEPMLWLRAETDAPCFHDGGDEVVKHFICEQGKTNMNGCCEMFRNQVCKRKKNVLKDNVLL